MAQSNKMNGNDAGPAVLRDLFDAPANQDLSIAAFMNRCVDYIIAEAKANELDISASGITVDFDQAAHTVTVTDPSDDLSQGYDTPAVFTAVAGDGKPRWSLTSGTDNLGIASPDQPSKNPGAVVSEALKASDGEVSGTLTLDTGVINLDEDASGTTEDYTPVDYTAPDFTPGSGAGDIWE